MAKFESGEFREKLFQALDICKSISLDGEVDGIQFADLVSPPIEDEEEADDLEINNESQVYLYMDEDGESKLEAEYFIKLSLELKNYEIENNSCVYGKNEAIFLINTLDYDTYVILSNIELTTDMTKEGYDLWWKSDAQINDIKYTVGFIKDQVTLFNMLLMKENNYDKEYPAYCSEDMFIRVSSDSIIDRKTARALADALIFELASSHNIKLDYTFRPDPLFSEYECNDELLEKKYNIFPLLTGKGIEELIKIYNRTLSVGNLDYQILCFTQVIEYIAPTVAREKLNSDVMQKLSSPNVFNPDARYIIELQKIYEINDKYKKDNELIKLTINKVLDIDEIKDVLPDFIYKFKAKQADVSLQIRSEISNKIAAAISDTRNQIAHAKANYQCKGNECPEEQKEKFVEVMSIIARQAVRWFANEPEEKRVV